MSFSGGIYKHCFYLKTGYVSTSHVIYFGNMNTYSSFCATALLVLFQPLLRIIAVKERLQYTLPRYFTRLLYIRKNIVILYKTAMSYVRVAPHVRTATRDPLQESYSPSSVLENKSTFRTGARHRWTSTDRHQIVFFFPANHEHMKNSTSSTTHADTFFQHPTGI